MAENLPENDSHGPDIRLTGELSTFQDFWSTPLVRNLSALRPVVVLDSLKSTQTKVTNLHSHRVGTISLGYKDVSGSKVSCTDCKIEVQ